MKAVQKRIPEVENRGAKSGQYRAARALLNLTQLELAECAGMKPQTVADVEYGKASVRAETLKKLWAVLVTLGITFTDDEDGIGVRRQRTLDEMVTWEAEQLARLEQEQEIVASEPISPAQCRAARALLAWTLGDLSRRSGIGATSLGAFEGERAGLQLRNAKALRVTLEQAGVEFISGEGLRPRGWVLDMTSPRVNGA